jgi:hypothetical protein
MKRIDCGTVAALAVSLGLAWPGAAARAEGDSHGSWMARHKELMRNLAVNQVALLGSHDAVSHSIHEGAKPAKGYLTHTGHHLSRHASAADLLSARCQSASIGEQLRHGVRYLDLRIAHQDHEYWGMHMWLSTTPCFGERGFLGEIKSFLADHPDEVVLLLAQHLYSEHGPMTPEEADAFYRKAEKDLEPLLIPRDDFSRLTFGEIWRGRGRIILIAGAELSTDALLAAHPNLWNGRDLDSQWMDQPSPVKLMAELDRVIAEWRDGKSARKLRHLQAMTTCGHKIESAATTAALLREKLAADWKTAPISVVQVDDSVHSDLMQILIDRLRQGGN